MTKTDDLAERVKQFNALKLLGQMPMTRTGTSYLVNDLWRELRRLRSAEQSKLNEAWRRIESFRDALFWWTARTALASWVLVPRVPTEAMLRIGAQKARDFYSHSGPYPRTKAIWSAMLAAAPSPPATSGDGWQPIETAPRDGTRILVIFKDSLPRRNDLERWNGIPFVARYNAAGWDFAAPVGMGGFIDDWIAGWRPLPLPPSTTPASQTGK